MHIGKQKPTIRRDRHGEPDQAFKVEIVDCPRPDSDEVPVMVIAAGVNYNGVWAGLGVPISPFDVHGADYHIAGSDASGIVCRRPSMSVWRHNRSPCKGGGGA